MLEIRGLTYTFFGNHVRALDGVDARFYSGRLSAIIGENGAGKSTLARIICGQLGPAQGSLFLDGQEIFTYSPLDALRLGLVLVPQHPQSVEELTVWENLALGLRDSDSLESHQLSRPLSIFRRSTLRKALETRLRPFALPLDLDQRCDTLDGASLHYLAIAEALLSKPRFLFLDEPSAPFSEQQVGHLYALLQAVSNQGVGVIVVTHRLQEITQYAQDIVVLRGGKRASLPLSQSESTPTVPDEKTLIQAMFGDQVGSDQTVPPFTISPIKSEQFYTPENLVVSNLSCGSKSRGGIDDLSFTALPGRIYGILALKDHGIELLEDIIIGLRKPDAGEVLFGARDIRRLGRAEVGYIPSRRFARGIGLDLTIGQTISVRGFEHTHIQLAQQAFAKRYNKPMSDSILTLSGGMIQNLIILRETSHPGPALLLACEVAYGLDRFTRDSVYQNLRSLSLGGMTIVLLSSDIQEILTLSDDIHVLYRGSTILQMKNPCIVQGIQIDSIHQSLSQAMIGQVLAEDART